MTRNRIGVYRHRRGESAYCNGLLSYRVISIRDHCVIPATPPPQVFRQPCLFCGLVVETNPGGLCPGCLGKQQVEEESA